MNKVQNLSGNDIEIKAEEFISYFDKSILDKPQMTPYFSIIATLKDEFGILVSLSTQLGFTESGHKILGKFISKPRAIMIDEEVTETERLPFTLAHEIGHLVLHRNLKIDKEDYSEITDTEYDLVTGKKILTTNRDWIEWQANKFASSFLLPRATFQNALIDIQRKMDITKNIGIVYVEKADYSLRDFNKIKESLAKHYQVSKTVVEFRLSNLKLLIDRRMFNVKHVSEFLKEE